MGRLSGYRYREVVKRLKQFGFHRTASWHPTIDKGVRQYEIKPVLSPSAGGSQAGA